MPLSMENNNRLGNFFQKRRGKNSSCVPPIHTPEHQNVFAEFIPLYLHVFNNDRDIWYLITMMDLKNKEKWIVPIYFQEFINLYHDINTIIHQENQCQHCQCLSSILLSNPEVNSFSISRLFTKFSIKNCFFDFEDLRMKKNSTNFVRCIRILLLHLRTLSTECPKILHIQQKTLELLSNKQTIKHQFRNLFQGMCIEPKAYKPSSDSICVICLDELDVMMENEYDEMNTLELPCNHIFHTRCMMQWIRIEFHCPTCRKMLSPGISQKYEIMKYKEDSQ